MSGKGCTKKHTPIVSKKQQRKFGAEYGRRKRGEKGTMPGITTAELKSHLKESKGKDLPERSGGRGPVISNIRKRRR